MIYTQNELDISNKSYTNKDFESIYLEILDYAEKLSKRFSPKDSNEADPYVVLLKLLAFVGDKINYNIDKNILERFMLSCTQQTSMNQLTDMLGYSPKYYQSAKTSVSFRYVFSSKDIKEHPNDYIKIPAHSILKDYNSTIQYVTLGDAFLYCKSGVSDFVDVIQGVLKTFNIYGSSTVLLENLDTHNRLYFPERMVAQNGVFITNSIFSNNWRAVDNLYTSDYNSGVYKFGYDDVLALPYIQFPEWINNIIGDGLTIQYIITNGSQGNISSNSLSSVTRVNVDTSSESISINDVDIGINNPYAATSGSDPESLDESYMGYKKTVGVFNTLVTCRDYAKAIYNLLNSYDEPFVSNCIVTDRRSDLNYGSNTLTLINDIPQTINIKITDPDTARYISPYDLCLYLFEPFFDIQGLDRSRKIEKYNKSFDLAPYGNNFVELVNQLELNTSNISHDYKKFKEGDIVSIENQFEIIATISTKTKITQVEAEDIILKVESELMKNFNARNLQFGQDLPFDLVLEVIENADSRIKKVALQDFDELPNIRYIKTSRDPENNSTYDTIYTTTTVALDNSDGISSDYFKVIIAKNILEGKISVFKYDEDFDYKIYQKDCQKCNNINYLTSKWYLDYSKDSSLFSNEGYTLNENEVIQFISPHMTVEKRYSSGVEYAFKRVDNSKAEINPYNDKPTPILKNSIYQLKDGEVLLLKFNDSNDQTIYEKLEKEPEKEIFIYTPFDLYDTDYKKETLNQTSLHEGESVKYDGKDYYFYLFDSSDELHILKPDIEVLNSGKYCYWILNNSDNKFKWDSKETVGNKSTCTYMLQDGEYFIFSDISFSGQIYYGSGSTITITAQDNFISDTFETGIYDKINIAEINSLGLSSLRNIFRYIEFTDNNKLEAIQNDLVTMISGDNIRFNGEPSEPANFKLFSGDNKDGLDNSISGRNHININDNILPKINNFSAVNYADKLILKSASNADLLLENRSLLDDSYKWQGRTILDLNLSAKKEQELILNHYFFNVDANNKISDLSDIIYLQDASKTEYLKANHDIQKSGGSVIDTRYFDLSDNKLKAAILLRYKKDNNTLTKIAFNTDTLTNFNLGGENTLGSTYKFTQKFIAYKEDQAGETKYRGYLKNLCYFYVSANSSNDNAVSGNINIKFNELDPILNRSGELKELTTTPDNLNDDNTMKVSDKGDSWNLNIEGITAEGAQFIWKINKDDEDPGVDIPNVYITDSLKTAIDTSGSAYLDMNFILEVSDDLKITKYDPETKNEKNNNIKIYTHNGSEHLEQGKTVSDYKSKLIACQISNIACGEEIIIEADNSKEGIKIFNSIDNSTPKTPKQLIDFKKSGLYIIELTSDVQYLEIYKYPNVQSFAKISISDVKYIKDINPDLNIDTSISDEGLSDTDILNFISKNYPEQFQNFYILGEADPVKRIDLPKDVKMNDAIAFYDVNNVANIYTIPKIVFSDDIANSGIKIAKSSIKY